jgi:hypothetical protein
LRKLLHLLFKPYFSKAIIWRYMKLFLIICFFSAITYSQQYVYDSSFGKFKDASAFSISSAGFIYVTDSGSDEIFKLDTLGFLLKEAGGYGWDQSAFDDPVDVFATPLNVYVSDKNNHRIQRFDKDLNFISQIFTRDDENFDMQFGYPTACVTNPQGDLFILDSENKRIIKFDLFGNFKMNFGGFDWGNYSLINPKGIAAAPNNSIFAVDENSLIIFDNFGNGVLKTETEENFDDINIVFSKIALSNSRTIYTGDLKDLSGDTGLKLTRAELIGKEGLEQIRSSFIFNQRLYVLMPAEINVYKIIQN